MKKTIAKFSLALLMTSLILVLFAFSVIAEVNPVTPSTNDINKTMTPAWAHVNQLSVDVGSTDLEFVSERGYWSCFEYRSDGDTSQIISENGGVNYNSGITDGLYPYYCLNNDSRTETIFANEYVEVRMVFGAEGDERFDWTRFDVIPPPPIPADKDECKEGGWMNVFRDDGSSFNNQGECIQYVNTGM